MGLFKLYVSAIYVLCISAAHAQFQFRFENIDKQQSGLSGLGPMIQDSKGFIWMGTGGGLYRYDGYDYKLFINDPANKNSLTLNAVGSLYEDRSGKIWIGTGNGPTRFDPASETFDSFPFFNERIQTGTNIRSIVEDSHGIIWFTMQTDQDSIGGLVFFDHVKNSFKVFNFDGLLYNPSTISLDEHGNLWIGSTHGIFIFDPVEKRIVRHIPSILTSETGAANSNVNYLYFEEDGVIWATSGGEGVSRIKYDQSYDLSFKNFQMKDGLMTNHIFAMIKDARGNYWFNSMGGAIVLNIKQNTVTNLRPSNENKYALRDGWCTSVLEDKSGVVWIGFNDFGFAKVKPNKGFIHITNQDLGFETLTGDRIISVYADTSDNIWMAVAGEGIHKIDFESNFNKPPKISFYPKEGSFVNSLDEDDNGNLIMAIGGAGMSSLDRSTGQFKQLLPYGTSIAKVLTDGSIFLSDVLRIYNAKKERSAYLAEELIPDSSTRKRRVWPQYSSITEESKNEYWLSSWHGDLYFYNNVSKTFTIPTIYPKESLRIADVHVDSNKFLWITAFEGIFKFKVEHNNKGVALNLVKKYTEKDGFISKSGASEIFTWTMQEDAKGNFWFAGAGLTQINKETDSLIHYYESDGVIEGSSPLQGSARLKNGYLVFATPSGAYLFHPDSLRINRHVPPIEITSFTILNGESLLTTNRKELKYFENVISFEFSALDFTEPGKNQYAYQMVGFDRDWIYSGNRRTATYTNLNPGTYTFKVKGSNNDGVWNEAGTSIEIIILPPPWKTWWAYTLYGLIVIALLVAARNEIVKRERLKSKAKLNEVETEKFREIDQLKSRFFANISHEFRTPLTLLLGPIEKRLASSKDVSDKTELTMMHRNASRLLSLVNQLLDLSRLEAGTLKLHYEHASLNSFITSIASQFSSMASSKQISFAIHANEEIMMYFDSDKLEKIVTNLLSNAFKFTPKGGSISLTIGKYAATAKYKDGFVEINVSDTGTGIESEHLSKIFDRFYQVDSSTTRAQEGSGIGLALTKELVELHHGTLSATSTHGHGSSFVVVLPLGKEHIRPEEIEDTIPDTASGDQKFIQLSDPATESNGSEPMDVSLPKVLIVEDNADLRYYLQKNLKDKFMIIESVNGAEGVARAIAEIPDLIISDLMMPQMDGFELCEKIKADEKTSHIPVILLTARADSSTRIDGFRTGADDYIAKPFNISELLVRIQNLIENRKKLQQKFSSRLPLAHEIKVISMDDRFLKKVFDAIEAHLSDNQFGVEDLAGDCAMSSVQLYRKVKALTGLTPNDLIRNVRLERAAQLLKQRAGNVAEVAYQVGFNNLSYFAKCFKDRFNSSPRDYLKQNFDKAENIS